MKKEKEAKDSKSRSKTKYIVIVIVLIFLVTAISYCARPIDEDKFVETIENGTDKPVVYVNETTVGGTADVGTIIGAGDPEAPTTNQVAPSLEEVAAAKIAKSSSSTDASKTTLFSEDFSGDLSKWTQSMTPTLLQSAIASKDLLIYTTEQFPSKNGLEVSFDLMPKSSIATLSGVTVKIVDKSSSSNSASVNVRADGSAIYYIQGHCVIPTPQVVVKSVALDNAYHKFTFRMHTDGTAEWVLDGTTEIQKTKFDIGGDYTITLSGSTAITASGTSDDAMLLDNVNVYSLGETASATKICNPAPVVVKNTCPAGKCMSNGVCCPSYAKYYCGGVCYTYREKAMSVSQGRCNEWKIIC